MKRRSLYFTSQKEVAVLEDELSPPPPGQVLVESLFSAISSGTELLIYRGMFPEGMILDDNITTLAGKFEYPFKYGYSCAGRVIDLGDGVDPAWEGVLVFAYNPHESHFLASTEQLQRIPENIPPGEAVFFPNMETAVNLVMDGQPRIGELAVVFGQGIIGLLTTALLSQFPLESLITLDRFPLRRQASIRLGAQASLDPHAPDTRQVLQGLLPGGADLAFELSGAPETLNEAINLVGFNGRVLIGSWYGRKHADLNLGERFHRNRIRLLSSQVSTIAPELSGRWTKARRFELAWKMLDTIQPARFITQRFDIAHAKQAYALIDQHPEDTIQVLLTYS